MKEFAKTILLRDDPDLVARYIDYHNHIWPEVVASFKEVGVLDIKIWMIGRRLFMLMITSDAFNPDVDLDRYLTLHDKNREWEKLMATFQERVPEAEPGEHWVEMDLIFQLAK